MSAERARLFVALELPAEVRDALRAWQETTVSRPDAWRPLGSESLHVTLCFLGDQAVTEVHAIARACANAVDALSEGVTLRLASPLTLSPRRPRVLAVGVEDPSGALTRLQARVAGALASAGWYQAEHRRFLAHITVARARARRGTRIVTAAGAIDPPAPLVFSAEAVALVRSHLSSEGSRYERLAGFPLSGTGEAHGP
ncbi:MAG TPA: RNA 2',3'-cyclic phosphodiesterase [Solirubrobacteraceae bacterium]